MVGERGFEPPTPWSQTRCATRLRHSPIPNRKRGFALSGRFCQYRNRGKNQIKTLKCDFTKKKRKLDDEMYRYGSKI